jgi:Ca-activated chloride channel family protein
MPSLHFSLTASLFPLLLCFSPLAVAQGVPPQDAQAIRISVDRVNIGVIVTDARGHLVEGLHRENFHILDNGIEQPVTDFAAVEEPAQILLLIEAGPAVYLLEDSHLRAAFALLEGLSADDHVAVVKYAEAPQAILDFTPDKQAAAAALDQLSFNLGFGSLNLSSSLSKVLDWLGSVRGKKTIVLLSTGVDTSPSNESGLLLPQLRTSEVRLLAVSLAAGLQNSQPAGKKKAPAAIPNPMVQQFEQAEQLLKQMAGATGGRAYFPSNTKEFKAVFAEIAQLVRHEYSLAFAPPARDGLVHSIAVRVDALQQQPSSAPIVAYRVDHRRGYIAPPPVMP